MKLFILNNLYFIMKKTIYLSCMNNKNITGLPTPSQCKNK